MTSTCSGKAQIQGLSARESTVIRVCSLIESLSSLQLEVLDYCLHVVIKAVLLGIIQFCIEL